MTQICVGLRCYHLDNGRLPDMLADLSPEYIVRVLPDPFTDKAFGYDPHADPPRVYSLGPDQTVDGLDEERGNDLSVELSFAAP